MALSWLLELFKGADDKGPVGELYKRVVGQARSTPFYGDLGVADDLDGRFDMIAIHYFLAMDRLRLDPALEGLSQKLANLIISDMDRSLREMGVGDLGVGRRVQNMGKALYGRMEMYDLAVQETDSDMMQEKLGTALMRNLYRSEAEVSPEAKQVCAYILGQRNHLRDNKLEDLISGLIEFKEVEAFINVK